MNNVLIYLQEKHLRPIGGPAGYCYNLKKGLDSIGVDNIYFLKQKMTFGKIFRFLLNRTKRYIRQLLPKNLRLKIEYQEKANMYGKVLYENKKHKSDVDFTKYDVIHFQTTLGLYSVRDQLKKFEGKIVLTSHSPTLPSSEIFDGLSEWEKDHYRDIYSELVKMDEYAFTNADVIIFPSEESEEPYFNNWPKFKEIKDEKIDNFKYLLTGIEPPKVRENRTSIRNRFGIPRSAEVICYVGRHNEIKGYDTLKELGSQLLNDNKDLFFLIAGKQAPLKGLVHDRWIEVGWTDDPHSLINASDIFLLPNKETYFDLILLEVLSIGTPVIASYTGGNKLFSKFQDSGIFLYNNLYDAKSIIEKVLSLSCSEREKLKEKNKGIFINNFTKEIFAQNYCDIILNL